MPFALDDISGDDEEGVEKIEKGDGGEPEWVEEAERRLDISRSQLEQEMEAVLEEFDGLVTQDDAAAILVARSRGVNLVDEVSNDPRNYGLQIDNIVGGLNNVNLKCRVSHLQDKNQFDGGQVRSIVVEDETGETQVACWDEDADKVGSLSSGDVIAVENAYTKEDMSDYQRDRYGIPQVQLGDDASLRVKDDGEWIEIV